MTSQELRAALQARPLRPFTVRMADDRSFEIRHRDFLLVAPNGQRHLLSVHQEMSSVFSMFGS